MKKCRTRGCDNEFTQYNTLQNLCVPCLVKKGRKIQEKTERKEHKLAKEKLMTKSDHAALAQAQCNRYIRARDKGQVCISCQKPPRKVQAGHYRSVGAQGALRFNESNIHLQCMYCNSHLSGNAIEYRIHLVEKLGVEMVEWLETDHPVKNYSIDELQEIKALYSEFARELEKDFD